LRIDTPTIDRPFVRDGEGDKNAVAIIMAFIVAARSLDLSVAAKGLEIEGQLATSRNLGCGEFQAPCRPTNSSPPSSNLCGLILPAIDVFNLPVGALKPMQSEPLTPVPACHRYISARSSCGSGLLLSQD